MVNKVGPHSSRSTLTVTLAWEHPFPVEIAHNIRIKVPQSTLPLRHTDLPITVMALQLPTLPNPPLPATACTQPRT